MAVDIVEQNAGEVGMVAEPETASRSLSGDRCSSLHAPSALRPAVDSDPVETKEWVDAFRGVLETGGVDRARFLIEQLGRSETRAALRRFFEVDAECIAIAVLLQLARRGIIDPGIVEQAIHWLGVDPEKVSPMRA